MSDNVSSGSLLEQASAAGFPVLATAEQVAVDPNALRLLPRNPHALPIALAGDVLSVLIDHLPTPAQFREIQDKAGMLIMLTVTTPEILEQVRQTTVHTVDGTPLTIAPALAEAVQRKASDLHLGVGSPPVVRVHGRLLPLPGWAALSAEDLTEAAQWIAGNLDSFTGDLDKSITYQGRRWRVSVYRQRSALALALRLIPTTPPPADSLGLPATVLTLAELVDGLVLFCGPTGSGKSTSMSSLVDRINRSRACHILTIEDPIEYLHPNRQAIVHQREVGQDTSDFATGLRSALRQDPDVILVGELRDLETMSTALAAAETGHLVLATVHASSAPSAVTRLISSFPASQQDQVRQQLAGSLRGVVYQQLMPSKQRGRVLATEVLTVTPAVRNVIREDRLHELSAMLDSSGSGTGMMSLDRSLALLVNAGAITHDAAQLYVRDSGVFDQFLRALPDRDLLTLDPLDSLPAFDETSNKRGLA